ncbi:MAG: Na+-transporting NADH:ubiquinone oxidoreductase subunit A [Sphingobacteriales bacterium]|jgi:Na+-transporting NADH:ubiquinone oxidoreductase subunit A
MSKTIKLKKGFDINLVGEAEKVFAKSESSDTFAIKPTDFRGVVPKLLIEENSKVKAGTPLFYSKDLPELVFTAPVSGEVVSIKRGAKRLIQEIIIKADAEISYEDFGTGSPASMNREQVVEKLVKSGLWTMLRRRPFSDIPDPKTTPKAIFVSAFDSSPLAPDYDFIVHGQGEAFQIGLDALKKLTDGTVHLNVNDDEKSSDVFLRSKGVQINNVSGPHPAGNVGIQIHHIDPINKGEFVWYVGPQDVITIGKLFIEGKYNSERIVAVTGSEVKHRKYYSTRIGANLTPMIKDNLVADHVRIISGNVLTGTTVAADGHLGFYESHVSVIPEGTESEFFGWLTPGFDRPSISKALFSYLIPGKKFQANTNLHGEERAFVMTGEYEKVLPMDIYPLQLIKSIMYNDIEEMEGLGIYEVSEEDFALCEFACTSKTDVQAIIAKGLETVKTECF